MYGIFYFYLIISLWTCGKSNFFNRVPEISTLEKKYRMKISHMIVCLNHNTILSNSYLVWTKILGPQYLLSNFGRIYITVNDRKSVYEYECSLWNKNRKVKWTRVIFEVKTCHGTCLGQVRVVKEAENLTIQVVDLLKRAKAEDSKFKKVIDNPNVIFYIFAVLISIGAAIVFIILYTLCCGRKRNDYENLHGLSKEAALAKYLHKGVPKKAISMKPCKSCNMPPKPDGFSPASTCHACDCEEPRNYTKNTRDPRNRPNINPKCPCHTPVVEPMMDTVTYATQDINKVFTIANAFGPPMSPYKTVNEEISPYLMENPTVYTSLHKCKFPHTEKYIKGYRSSSSPPTSPYLTDPDPKNPYYEKVSKTNPAIKPCQFCNAPLNQQTNLPINVAPCPQLMLTSHESDTKKASKTDKTDKKKIRFKSDKVMKDTDKFCPYDPTAIPKAPATSGTVHAASSLQDVQSVQTVAEVGSVRSFPGQFCSNCRNYQKPVHLSNKCQFHSTANPRLDIARSHIRSEFRDQYVYPRHEVNEDFYQPQQVYDDTYFYPNLPPANAHLQGLGHVFNKQYHPDYLPRPSRDYSSVSQGCHQCTTPGCHPHR